MVGDHHASHHPGVQAFWNDFLDDARATADEYRENDWEVQFVHPGAVTPLPAGSGDVRDERVGLDVLSPGDEFRAVEEMADAAAFSEFDAYRAERDGVVFLVVVMKAPETGQAVVLPVYYVVSEAGETIRLVRERDEMRLYVRPLSDERRVVFTQEDPELLLPAEDGGGDEADDESDETDDDATAGGDADTDADT